MRDVDDARAFGPQRADHPVQPLHVVAGQDGRRLIHDQDAHIHGQRFGNLDDLLFADGQMLDDAIRIQVCAESVEQRQRAPPPMPRVE